VIRVPPRMKGFSAPGNILILSRDSRSKKRGY
jgi:hypothetical protein